MKKPVNSLSASVNQNQFWIETRLDVSRKQFGSRSGPTHTGPDLDPNLLMLKVFLFCFVCFFVIFLKKVSLKKIRMMLLKSYTYLPSM